MIPCNDILDSSDGLSIFMSAARVASPTRRPSAENRYSQGDYAGIEQFRRIRLAHESDQTMRRQRREDKMLADWEQTRSGIAECFTLVPHQTGQMQSGQIVFESTATEFQVLPRKSLAFLGRNRRPDVALKI